LNDLIIRPLNEKRTGEFLFGEDDDGLLNDPEIEGKRCKANKRVKKSEKGQESEEGNMDDFQ